MILVNLSTRGQSCKAVKEASALWTTQRAGIVQKGICILYKLDAIPIFLLGMSHILLHRPF